MKARLVLDLCILGPHLEKGDIIRGKKKLLWTLNPAKYTNL